MRVLGLDVRRFADEADPVGSRAFATGLPTGDDSAASASAQGSDLPWSISMAGMRPTENPELMGKVKYAVFDDMRWSDPAIKSALWTYKQPMRAGKWLLSPASDDPLDGVVRDAVAWALGIEDNIGQVDLSWTEQLAQAFLMLDYGAMFEEILWGDPTLWGDADGDPHILRPISRLAPRFASSLRFPDGIRVDPMTGKIAWLIQDVPGGRPIPGVDAAGVARVTYFVLDREGTDYFGTSLLRPMYGPWRLKRALMLASGIAWDRYALGIPAVWYPRGGGTQKKIEAENVARNFRTHERAWIVFEGKRGDPSGWDIDIIGGDKTVSDPTALIRLYDEQIFTGAMQHFMVLGRTGGGNRALGEALGEPFYLAAQAIAEDVALQKMRGAMRAFVDVNFGTHVPVPRLNVSGIQTHNIQELATAIYDLAQAGLSFTDVGTQNDVRDLLGLSDLPVPPDVATAAIEAIETLPDDVGVAAPGSGPEPYPGQRTPPKGQPPVPTDKRPLPIAELSDREGDGLNL